MNPAPFLAAALVLSATRTAAPDTATCPQATWPPGPVTTSEAAAPAPQPLPVTYHGSCGVSAPAGFVVDESVLASAWLVADLDTGDIIAEKDPHGRYRPASIVKVLLALVTIRELPLDQVVVVTQESADQEGSAVGVVAGGTYTVNDLLHGLLMASGNDAAHALAQQLGGDDETLRKVNDLAHALGMADTRAVSYTGLDAAGMSTSAYDMGLAYRAAFADPTFAGIVATDFYPFPGQNGEPGFEVWNDNALYLNDPDGIGGKTGYTDDANHTFVGAVNHAGRRLVAVVLDTTVDKARPWQQAQSLLHESYRFTQPVGTLGAGDSAREATAAEPASEPSAKEPPAIIALALVAVAVALWGASRALAARARRRR
ncbi:D-alanyl-D-alanine carboxypeptidase DacB precursor [Corynebacterium capitovis DSM 44611]|uniref:D-alanyl-D-alanine carboxypeptidase family protein n=1 Tax=Corynebacterium capitovis TaxID=131081 RepID=UPI000373667C|nr:D-alanyl-D-alanine carboxypeptidase family protein [Corynebacterium capitovis]WKD56967.1 D-alanyl-D-alanine carboxypeptidase DacB precursor [Corynebacterium capitovis DSM 44611]